jgi:integrase
VEDPLAELRMLNASADRRHDRRPLSSDELKRLVEAAEVGKPVEGITGRDRAMVYLLAAWTGYRKGEIASLTSSSFDLKGEPPTVTVEALYSNR